MNYADKAENLFRSGLNCAQAVSGAFCDVFSCIDELLVLDLASPFGGGFARKRDLCGAVSGMGIVFGLTLGTHTGEEKLGTYASAAALTDRFIDRYESIVCSELLEKTPDLALADRKSPLTEDEKQAHHWPCIDYVRVAAKVTEEYLREHGVIK